MLLRRIKIILVIVFSLVAIAFCAVVVNNYLNRDISAPVFTCSSDILEVSVNASQQELCYGMHAYDNIDGDITDRIVVKTVSRLFNATDATVTYLVFDNASNPALYERTIRYTDYRAPRFQLKKPLVFSVDSTITLLDRLTASDVLDGDISGKVMLTQSQVSNAVAGNYSIVVQVTNSLGDSAVLPLTIIVRNETASTPTITLKSNLKYICVGETIDFTQNIRSARDPLRSGSMISEVQCNTDALDTSAAGVYEVYYYLTGESGETTTAILTVVVE